MSLLSHLSSDRPRDDGTSRPASQTERALAFLLLLGVTGLLAILVESVGFGPWTAARFLGVGVMAALVALSFGGVLGLLFSLPTNARQIVVVTAPQGQSDGDVSAAQAAVPGSGYADNNSLQQIGTWLTGAIVALSLTQFDNLAIRFDRLAAEVSQAMTPGCAGEKTPSAAVPRLPYDLPASTHATPGGEAQCRNEAPGGLILGTYAVIGFLLSYLWGRRYLPRELTSSQREGEDALDPKRLGAQAASANLVPAYPMPAKSDQSTRAAPLSYLAPSSDFPPAPDPGVAPNDPWKGAFGGLPASSVAEMSAAVIPAPGNRERFLVDLRVQGVSATQRDALRGRQARIFLHPTYPDYVRIARFDGNGEIRLALEAYGAFTVGAQLQDGTLLELDLANIPNAPALFKSR